MFPLPKTTDMLVELDQLGFGNTTIRADYMTVIAVAYEKKTGTYVRATTSTIEGALFELINLVKMFNSFSEETRANILQAQKEEQAHERTL